MKTTSSTRSRMRVQSLDKARRALNQAHRQFGTWRAVGEHFGIPAGTACSVAKGRDPKPAYVRKALSLPLYKPAPACANCGDVHVSRRCPAKRKPNDKPRRIWQRACMDAWGILWGAKDKQG